MILKSQETARILQKSKQTMTEAGYKLDKFIQIMEEFYIQPPKGLDEHGQAFIDVESNPTYDIVKQRLVKEIIQHWFTELEQDLNIGSY